MAVAKIILGVLALCVVLVIFLFRLAKKSDRLEHDLRYRRRCWGVIAGVWLAYTLLEIAMIVLRKEPIESLVGLPVVGAILWVSWRSTRVDKTPP